MTWTEDTGMERTESGKEQTLLVDNDDKTEENDASSSKSTLWLLCIVAFLLNFKPSEPFLTNYFYGVKGFTKDEINKEIYPYWTYSYAACLVPAGLLAEWVGYKNATSFGFVLRELTRFILIFGATIPWMRVTEISYGYASAAQWTFFAYLYGICSPEMYQQATGYMRGAWLFGHVISSGLGQVVLYEKCGMLPANDQHECYTKCDGCMELVYVSMGTVSAGAIMFLFLPSPTKGRGDSIFAACVCSPGDWRQGLRGCAAELRAVVGEYRNTSVFFWSLWWCITYPVFELSVGYYGSSLFLEKNPALSTASNGLVFAIATLVGILGTNLPYITARFVESELNEPPFFVRWGGIVRFVATFGAAATMWVLAYADNLDIIFAFYILGYAIFEFIISISTASIARGMSRRRYSAVFILNTCVSLFSQSVLQAIFMHTDVSVAFVFLVFAVWLSCALVFITALWFGLKRHNDYKDAVT